MGSAGRAIGPDGKPLKQQPKKNIQGGRVGGQGRPQNRGPQQRFPNAGPGGPHPMMMGGGPMGPGMPPMGPGMGQMGPGMGPMGGPMGPRMGPGGPGGPPFPMRAPFRGSGPDPSGSFGFFNGGAPAQMTDGGNGTAPAAPVPAPNVAKVAPTTFNNQMNSGRAPQPPAATAQGTQPVGEVPGFGTNSSIHELFGKMVWRKMEGLRDQAVIDRLQNRIMNLIHDALADQAADQPGSQNAAANNGAAFRAF